MSEPLRYMRRALELAALGLHGTDPNPRVGCVLVLDGQIVGEGWHERAGEAHAEVQALRAAGASAQGATAYVSLEPCAHQGRTPPCVAALIAARVARVVYAVADPNPLVNGAGAAALREAGIEVTGDVLSEPAQALNPGFFKRMQTGLPWVRVKLAASLDGRTALANGSKKASWETKLAYLEETLQVLNQVVARQQKQIDQLESLCRDLRERARNSTETLFRGTPADEVPPHY